MKIISGNGNRPLAEVVSSELGVSLTEATITRFSDNEIFVEIHENVRGEDIFLIQPTSYPANDTLMELLITIDALKRGSARRINAIIPYFGYARQDRKMDARTPITAKLAANLITVAGADRVLTFDLHAGQIQGFFDIPLDDLHASIIFREDILKNFNGSKKVTIVSPDIGGVVRARAIAKRVNGDLAIIDKRREKANTSEVMNIIGDVEGQHCLLVDDIVDSGGTLCNAAKALTDAGAASVDAYAIHGVLSGNSIEKIQKSAIRTLVITDSIQAPKKVISCPKVRFLSIGPLLADAIKRIHENRSISALFK